VTTNDVASDLTAIVDQPDFALSISPGTFSLFAGQSTTYTVTVTSVNGNFASPVQLAINGLPQLTSAAFSPASVTPGSNAVTSNLTIVTEPGDPYVAWNRSGRNVGIFAIVFPAMGIVLSGFVPRERRKRIFVAIMLFSLLVAGSSLVLSGCASSQNFRRLGTP